MNGAPNEQRGEQRKRGKKTKKALLAEGEKYANITDLFSRNSPGGCAASNDNVSLEVSSDTDIQDELEQEGEDKRDDEGSKRVNALNQI